MNVYTMVMLINVGSYGLVKDWSRKSIKCDSSFKLYYMIRSIFISVFLILYEFILVTRLHGQSKLLSLEITFIEY